MEGKGPVGEDGGEKKSWQCGGLCATQWGNGALASVGHRHGPVASLPCDTGSGVVVWLLDLHRLGQTQPLVSLCNGRAG